MSPLKDLFQRFQSELGLLEENLRNQWAHRQLDTDIREIDTALRDWQQEANACKARLFTADERKRALNAEIHALEAEAVTLLASPRGKSRAADIAARIAKLQARRNDERAAIQILREQQQALLHVIEQGEHKLRRLKHQLDTLRASETLHRAQATVARRQAGEDASPESAVASARRARSGAKAAGSSHKPRPQPAAEDAAAKVLEKLQRRAEKQTESKPPKPRRSKS
ncbi:hypothetical protein CO615_04870 [Lysobacteraceae bacterium NML75-0749]|nr:hypothetical protein CO615_04870 [Xanthomonadaceae bacterium NML75-0749]PJK04979.1 hypothetical protein CO609_04880 [Xanthomonadaceae bacterium NML91-0268]